MKMPFLSIPLFSIRYFWEDVRTYFFLKKTKDNAWSSALSILSLWLKSTSCADTCRGGGEGPDDPTPPPPLEICEMLIPCGYLVSRRGTSIVVKLHLPAFWNYK